MAVKTLLVITLLAVGALFNEMLMTFIIQAVVGILCAVGVFAALAILQVVADWSYKYFRGKEYERR